MRDAVDYIISASLATLDIGSQQREQWLYGMYQMGSAAIDAGTRSEPFAYVIGAQQHDLPAAARFVEVLMLGGVEVQRATQSFRAGDTDYPAGSYVVPMAQPFRAYAKDLLEPQKYPDRRQSPNGPPIPPYDITGWTLAYQMGRPRHRHSEAIRRDADTGRRLIDGHQPHRRTGPDSLHPEPNARATVALTQHPGSVTEPGLRSGQRVACRRSARIARHDPAGGERAGVDQRRVRRVRTNARTGRARRRRFGAME